MNGIQIFFLCVIIIVVVAKYANRTISNKRIELLKDLPESKIIAMAKYEKAIKDF